MSWVISWADRPARCSSRVVRFLGQASPDLPSLLERRFRIVKAWRRPGFEPGWRTGALGIDSLASRAASSGSGLEARPRPARSSEVRRSHWMNRESHPGIELIGAEPEKRSVTGAEDRGIGPRQPRAGQAIRARDFGWVVQGVAAARVRGRTRGMSHPARGPSPEAAASPPAIRAGQPERSAGRTRPDWRVRAWRLRRVARVSLRDHGRGFVTPQRTRREIQAPRASAWRRAVPDLCQSPMGRGPALWQLLRNCSTETPTEGRDCQLGRPGRVRTM